MLSTRFYRLHLVGINSILSTSSGKDRLDVFYQLDLVTASGKDRLDSRSLGGKGEFRGWPDMAVVAVLDSSVQ